jgi:hypothetical protein
VTRHEVEPGTRLQLIGADERAQSRLKKSRGESSVPGKGTNRLPARDGSIANLDVTLERAEKGIERVL